MLANRLQAKVLRNTCQADENLPVMLRQAGITDRQHQPVLPNSEGDSAGCQQLRPPSKGSRPAVKGDEQLHGSAAAKATVAQPGHSPLPVCTQ